MFCSYVFRYTKYEMEKIMINNNNSVPFIRMKNFFFISFSLSLFLYLYFVFCLKKLLSFLHKSGHMDEFKEIN